MVCTEFGEKPLVNESDYIDSHKDTNPEYRMLQVRMRIEAKDERKIKLSNQTK